MQSPSSTSSTSPITIAYIVLIHVVFFALQISAAVLVLAERKVAAFSQQRLGPVPRRAGGASCSRSPTS